MSKTNESIRTPINGAPSKSDDTRQTTNSINFGNIIGVFFEGIQSTGSAMSFIVSIITGTIQLSTDSDFELSQQQQLYILAVAILLSIIDSYVHYTIYDKYSDEDNTPTPPPETQPLLSVVSDHQPNEPGLKHFTEIKLRHKILVFFCTLSCSLDRAGAPAVFMYILHALKLIDPTKKAIKITQLSLTGISGLAALCTSPTLWNMGKQHMQTYIEKYQQEKLEKENNTCSPHLTRS